MNISSSKVAKTGLIGSHLSGTIQGEDDSDIFLVGVTGLGTNNSDYYPKVAINALVRALRDPNMTSHHSNVVVSLFGVLNQLGLQAVPFLPHVSFRILFAPSVC